MASAESNLEDLSFQRGREREILIKVYCLRHEQFNRHLNFVPLALTHLAHSEATLK